MNDDRFRCSSSTRLHLPTLGYSVSPTAMLSDARLSALAAEDIAWHATRDAWRHRRPKWWQRSKQRQWIAEFEELTTAREQLRDLARSLGLPVWVSR